MKIFESFTSFHSDSLFIASDKAENVLKRTLIYDKLTESNGFYQGSSVQKAVEILEKEGFNSPEHFFITESINEAFGKISSDGLKGDQLLIKIDNHQYGYKQKEGGLDLKDIARKFEKMLQFSAGKALSWLKKNAEHSSGGKKDLEKDSANIKESHEDLSNYMFFQNLHTIKKCVDKMLALDMKAMDEMLNEHDWASDHITSSKDDVEEVCNFFCNNLGNTYDKNSHSE
jgi:hypothetical protein